MSGGRQEAWRWSAGGVGKVTIQVIEPPDAPPPARVHDVPFGFGVRDAAPLEPRQDPLLWEGDYA